MPQKQGSGQKVRFSGQELDADAGNINWGTDADVG